ncbi:MAG: 16S rRNA (guanine(527)-N(7))-methyltransferase RsmG [Candidatus Acidiferrales bacterium]
MTLSAARVQTLLKPYGPPAFLQTCCKIIEYIELLQLWNKKIALTSISNAEEIVRFHFGESIFALTLEGFERGRLADVGSGAGFPGLALKLFRPDLQVTLLEPNKKKCAFLNEVARRLEFSQVEILPIGFEESGIEPRSISYIASRALGKTTELLHWSRKMLSPTGSVVLWLGTDATAETKKITDGWTWPHCADIPGSEKRQIMVGRAKI